MSVNDNPARQAFLASFGASTRVGQVLIERFGEAFALQHVDDRDGTTFSLHPIAGLRELAQTTDAGAFRPLHAAPNLKRGWNCQAANAAELETALEHLYPGFLADWFTAQSTPPPVTNYRPFAQRQTGMYRLAAQADDAQAAQITRACCDARFCLKRRLWTAPGLAPDPLEAKSVIPCLEPCALLLEYARKAMRISQEGKTTVELAPSDLATLQAALKAALQAPAPDQREADFNDPANPRRVLAVWTKITHPAGG